MSRLALLFAATALSVTSPVLAQHRGHHMPAPAKPQAKPTAGKPAVKKTAAKTSVAKKPAAKKPAAKKAVPARKAPARPAADPHADHAMPPTDEQADPHAGHAMPPTDEQADPHAGHAMPAGETDPHSGHDMAATAQEVPLAPPPAEAFAGPEHAADLFYGDGPMARSRVVLAREHGDILAWRFLLDRFEARLGDGPDGYAFDGDAWIGGDIDKAWLKFAGEGEMGGKFEEAEVQALWSHAIGPFFDLQAGLRYDARRGPDRAHLVVGAQGLAPYWIEVDGAFFLSSKGDLTAAVEAEHDVRITQRLILQPRVEAGFSLQNVPELGLGSGLTEAALGARLRYQVTPLFAPYAGVEYGRSFGATRRFRRLAGDEPGGWALLAGMRAWF